MDLDMFIRILGQISIVIMAGMLIVPALRYLKSKVKSMRNEK